MRIARCLIKGSIFYGVVKNNTVRQIKGNPFGKLIFTGSEYKTSEVKLLAPSNPSKILALALNYKSHLEDQPAPSKPEPFFKAPTCVIGPDEPIIIPKGARRVEEEAELVAVIGRRCSKVSKEKALDHVLGYTCGNDVAKGNGRGEMPSGGALNPPTLSDQ